MIPKILQRSLSCFSVPKNRIYFKNVYRNTNVTILTINYLDHKWCLGQNMWRTSCLLGFLGSRGFSVGGCSRRGYGALCCGWVLYSLSLTLILGAEQWLCIFHSISTYNNIDIKVVQNRCCHHCIWVLYICLVSVLVSCFCCIQLRRKTVPCVLCCPLVLV